MNTVEHICESDDEDNEADYFFAIVPGLDRPQFDLQINGFKVKEHEKVLYVEITLSYKLKLLKVTI